MPTYDVFLSHAGADKPAVEALARRLRDEEGLRVFFDRWELVPGAPWQEALEQALADSRTYAVFLGPQGLGPWHNAEMRVALGQRVTEAPKRVASARRIIGSASLRRLVAFSSCARLLRSLATLGWSGL